MILQNLHKKGIKLFQIIPHKTLTRHLSNINICISSYFLKYRKKELFIVMKKIPILKVKNTFFSLTMTPKELHNITVPSGT